jgi:hypothetical protein
MAQLNLPNKIIPQYTEHRRLGEPQSSLKHSGEEKNFLRLPEIKPCFVSFPAHDLVTITNTITEAMAAINGDCLMSKQKPKQNYNGKQQN